MVTPYPRIDLFISTGRRIALFKETISSLLEKNPKCKDLFTKVWILDDRSNWRERMEMTEFGKFFFGDSVSLMTFDNTEPFAWVDKFNTIGKLCDDESYVFLLEDDWLCTKEINWDEIIDKISSNPEITQISMCDPIWIQEDYYIKENQNNSIFWENPWPREYRHILHCLDDDNFIFNEVRMNHYTNNPSITRASVFKENKFERHKEFENKFADIQKSPKQLFLKDLIFRHLGYNQQTS